VRARVYSPTGKNKQDSKIDANSKLEHIPEREAMAQHQKEKREHARLANKLSRSERVQASGKFVKQKHKRKSQLIDWRRK